MTKSRRSLVGALAMLCAVAGVGSAAEAKRSWSEEKCFRYARDWSEALRRYGTAGFSAEFLAGNAAFIRSGCESRDKVCPSNAKDRELVDVMAIRVVNEGMSTTFVPFGCLHSP